MACASTRTGTCESTAASSSPWLGDSYANIASFGLSFQRSQNGGRYVPVAGHSYSYYTRTASRVTAPDKETSIFDGIDTSYAGLFKTLGRTAPAGVDSALTGIDAAVARAASGFRFTDPASSVAALAEGLRLTRDVIAKSASEPDALFILRIKERQIPGGDKRGARAGVVGDGRGESDARF